MPAIKDINRLQLLNRDKGKETAMSDRKIYITEYDMERLHELLNGPLKFGGRDKEHLLELEKELSRAEIVPPKDMPQDVITMNSKVRLKDLDSGKEKIYTLVFPKDADVTQDKISILAPIGTALLGYRVGDDISWEVPKGKRTLRIEEILYQPEAAGHYDL